jgi:hypothetical protein
MEPEEKNVILTPELLQEIVELASTTAVESYQKELDKAKREAKREREEARKKNLYNTRILLENYRGFVEHSKKAVYDASQVTEDEDLDKLVEELMSGPERSPHPHNGPAHRSSGCCLQDLLPALQEAGVYAPLPDDL